MRALGLSEEQIAAQLARGQRKAKPVKEVAIWPEHELPLDVLRRSLPSYTSAAMVGVSAVEVEAVMRIMRVPVLDRISVFDDVSVMAAEIARIRQAQAKERVEKTSKAKGTR